jgi:hypothetical protein
MTESVRLLDVAVQESTVLRFKIGDRVVMHAHGDWEPGAIVETFYEHESFPAGKCAAYLVQLDGQRMPNQFYVPNDDENDSDLEKENGWWWVSGMNHGRATGGDDEYAITWAQLRSMAKKGKLEPSNMGEWSGGKYHSPWVFREGSSAWVAASSVEGLEGPPPPEDPVAKLLSNLGSPKGGAPDWSPPPRRPSPPPPPRPPPPPLPPPTPTSSALCTKLAGSRGVASIQALYAVSPFRAGSKELDENVAREIVKNLSIEDAANLSKTSSSMAAIVALLEIHPEKDVGWLISLVDWWHCLRLAFVRRRFAAGLSEAEYALADGDYDELAEIRYEKKERLVGEELDFLRRSRRENRGETIADCRYLARVCALIVGGPPGPHLFCDAVEQHVICASELPLPRAVLDHALHLMEGDDYTAFGGDHLKRLWNERASHGA